jgi:regulator of chromosome condensation
MAPRGKSRAASKQPDNAKAAKPTVNGTGTSSSHHSSSPCLTGVCAGRGRAKKSEPPTTNGETAEPVKKTTGTHKRRIVAPTSSDSHLATGRGRPKKSETPVAAPKPAAKRKKIEESEAASDVEPEAAPAAKKAKIKDEKAAIEDKPRPKGPRRVRGKKTEINAIRYTTPLKVFVFGEGSSGELGLGATKKAIDVKRPRFNELLSNMNVVKIAAGGMHVVALTADNKILTWGVNDNGALGRDTSGGNVKMRDMDADDSGSDSDSDDETGGLNDAEATPTAVSSEYFPEDTTFVDVVAGDSCSFALRLRVPCMDGGLSA